jgi:hypothetical protein
MLWLGIGMMGLQLVPDTGETREKARRISRSCFPTRCYGYGYLAPPVDTVRRYKDVEDGAGRVREIYCSRCTSRRRLSAVCYIGMRKNRVNVE